MARRGRGRPPHPDVLTPAEWRVLEELRTGATNAEIAVRLGVSPDTVKYHVSNMLGKLGLEDRHALAAWRPGRKRPGRRRLRALLTLPAPLASLTSPLVWGGAALAVAGGVAVLAVVLVVVPGDGDAEPPLAVAPTATATPTPTTAPTPTPTATATPTPTPTPTATPGAVSTCDEGAAVPNAADNTVLVEDCGALLALKATLAGTGTLNWSPDVAMADWDGVVVGGSPPRVVELQLAGSGLTGELSGLLGNLPELTTLRLEGNLLTGTIPSKLANLDSLTDLRLGGNPLRGCVPFSLQGQATNDLASLGLPDCDPPIDISYGEHTLTEGSYRYIVQEGASTFLIFDVPAGLQLELEGLVYEARTFDEDGTPIQGAFGLILRVAGSKSWIGLDLELAKEWRRWPDEPDEETARLFDQIVDSAWLDWPR